MTLLALGAAAGAVALMGSSRVWQALAFRRGRDELLRTAAARGSATVGRREGRGARQVGA